MTHTLIWLHEEALRVTHPVFKAAPEATRAVFIWDDHYLQKLDYSLKRLVFIYETLCGLPVDIIRGDTLSSVKELAPTRLFIPGSDKPHIVSMTNVLKTITNVEIIKDEEFAQLRAPRELKRFFKYWSLAEETAFLKNGGIDA